MEQGNLAFNCTRFEAAWDGISKGRKLYWVEHIVSYQNPICRSYSRGPRQIDFLR